MYTPATDQHDHWTSGDAHLACPGVAALKHHLNRGWDSKYTLLVLELEQPLSYVECPETSKSRGSG